MKFKINQIILISISTSLFFGPFQRLFQAENFDEVLYSISDISLNIIYITNIFCFLLYALFTYFFLFHYYQKLSSKNIILILALSSIPIILIRYLIQEIAFDSFWGFTNYNRSYTIPHYIRDNLYYSILYMGIAATYYFVQYSNYKDLLQKQSEIENKSSELSFLKSQINPHFLFNILNNIYSLINKKSDKSLIALEKLSKLLRYSLYESEQEVNIQQEIDYLNDFIELQSMRYDFDMEIKKEISPNLKTQKIAPFIFIPFIENAFKHGEVKDPENPIEITLFDEEQNIVLKVRNKCSDAKKDEHGGIGLENTKKRLQLIYPNRHSLKIDQVNGLYEIELRIELNI